MDITFRGLNLGDGSLYRVTEIDGWEDLPAITNGSAPKPRASGSWAGGLTMRDRVITMSVEIDGDPEDEWFTTRPKRELLRAMQPTEEESPLYIYLGFNDEPTIANVRVTALSMPTKLGHGHLAKAVIEFTATDPRKFAAARQTQQTPPSRPRAGAAYGQPYGFKYAESAGPQGSFVARNAGDAPAPVEFEILGPIRQPSITLIDDAGARRTQFNIDLGATDRLVIDTSKTAVSLNGADRFDLAMGAIIGTLTFRPGETTVVFEGESAADSKASLGASWRNATN